MLVTRGGVEASVSVITTRFSEAGPSRFLVNALTVNLYFV